MKKIYIYIKNHMYRKRAKTIHDSHNMYRKVLKSIHDKFAI